MRVGLLLACLQFVVRVGPVLCLRISLTSLHNEEDSDEFSLHPSPNAHSGVELVAATSVPNHVPSTLRERRHWWVSEHRATVVGSLCLAAVVALLLWARTLYDDECRTEELPNTWAKWWGPQTRTEWCEALLASVNICCAQVPTVVAVAAMSGLNPAAGLQGAWITGMVCALLGCSPGVINGSSAALASLSTLHLDKGHFDAWELSASVILAGVMMMVLACLHLPRLLFDRLLAVKIGFCNGLVVSMAIAQLMWLKTVDGDWISGGMLRCTLLHVAVTTVIMVALPRISPRLPAAMVALIVGVVMEFWFFRTALHTSTAVVGDLHSFVSTGPVSVSIIANPDIRSLEIDIRSVQRIILQSVMISVLTLFESSSTLDVVGSLTGKESTSDRHLFVLGIASATAGMFGTMGGSAVLGLSVMGVQCGGTTRVSNVLASVWLFLFVACAGSLVDFIPCGTLTGTMVLVIVNTARWSSCPGLFAALVPRTLVDRATGTWMKWLREVRLDPFDALCITFMTLSSLKWPLTVSTPCVLLLVCLRTMILSVASLLKNLLSSRSPGAAVLFSLTEKRGFGQADMVQFISSHRESM